MLLVFELSLANFSFSNRQMTLMAMYFIISGELGENKAYLDVLSGKFKCLYGNLLRIKNKKTLKNTETLSIF